MNNTTTTRNGFRVEDITFRDSRLQSEILKEGVSNVEVAEKEPEAPKSLTTEQVNSYLLKCIQSTEDNDKRRVFAHIIHSMEELEIVKKELTNYKLKELQSSQIESTPDDVQE